MMQYNIRIILYKTVINDDRRKNELFFYGKKKQMKDTR